MKVLTVKVCSILIVLFYVVGCGKPITKDEGQKHETNTVNHSDSDTVVRRKVTPDSYMIQNSENYIDYQTGYECSAFASAYVLRHFGEKAGGMELYADFPGKMQGGGVMPDGIVTFFENRGYEIEYREDGTIDDIKQEVSKGTPIIVFIHIEEPYSSVHNTHYIPMIGYDKDYIYVAESIETLENSEYEETKSYNRKIEIPKFQRLWENIDGVWDFPYYVIRKN